MELDFEPVAPGEAARATAPEGRRYVITAIGPTLGAAHLHALASTLASEGANIEKIGRLSENTLASVEIHAFLPHDRDSEALKRTLLQVATSAGFDVSLQRESLFRRSKRLVVMDMDSTLIRIEVIDELARAAGVGPEVARITERAMQGEMDYDESLRQRVALLKGLDVAVLDRIAADLPLTDGAETLVRVLKRLGYRIAVISGGFSRAAEALKRRLGIDYAYSNNLEVQEGKLTGRVVGPIVNAQTQGRAARDDRAGRGHPARPGDRGRRRRQRPAHARARRPGHRLPRQAQAARARRHQHLVGRSRHDPLPARSVGERAARGRVALRLRRLGALVVLWPALAWAAPPEPPGPAPHGVHLSWVRDGTAAGCPDAAAIEGQVVARLGENPFARAPSQFIEALVARPADAFQVTIAMRGLRRPADRKPHPRQRCLRLHADRNRRRADDRHPDRSRGAGACARARRAATSPTARAARTVTGVERARDRRRGRRLGAAAARGRRRRSGRDRRRRAARRRRRDGDVLPRTANGGARRWLRLRSDGGLAGGLLGPDRRRGRALALRAVRRRRGRRAARGRLRGRADRPRPALVCRRDRADARRRPAFGGAGGGGGSRRHAALSPPGFFR